jgi:hypothetical protein
MGRDNFSYEGAQALMEWLEEYVESAGEPLEYDPIAFCCDYAEYADIEEYNKDGFEYEDIDALEQDTQVIRFDGGIIVHAQ